jgi:GDSL-like Lipase/Acylhydrolase family
VQNLAHRKLVLLFVAVFTAVIASAAVIVLSDSGERPSTSARPQSAVPMAVLGDSDSHSFHDRTHFPHGSDQRGGEYRAITFNWPEVLMRLRGDQIDLGEWGSWGPTNVVAKAREVLKLPVRRPQKEDYRYNFAINGAGCKDLNHGWRQVDRLLATMRLESTRWEGGVIVFRIGVNDIGDTEHLTTYAASPDAEKEKIDYCLDQIESAVARIRELQPGARFVLVGMFNNAHWARDLDKWQSPAELANISLALNRFDARLEQLAAADPNIAFFDDRAWFDQHWGSRDDSGRPAYKTISLPSGLRVTNSQGDEPTNATLNDGHAGTVWNGLWAQSLIELINQEFGLAIRPIDTAEVDALVSRHRE